MAQKGQLAQSIVREFFAIVQQQQNPPWRLTLGGNSAEAVLQAPALLPLFPGGTFTHRHKQQVWLCVYWLLVYLPLVLPLALPRLPPAAAADPRKCLLFTCSLSLAACCGVACV